MSRCRFRQACFALAFSQIPSARAATPGPGLPIHAHVEATSTATTQKTAVVFKPEFALDYSPTTAWCVSGSAAGRGESLTVTFDESIAPSRIEVRTGTHALTRQQKATIAEIEIGADGAGQIKVRRANGRLFGTLDGRSITKLTVSIAKTHGSSLSYSCIRDIKLFRKDGSEYRFYLGSVKSLGSFQSALSSLREAFKNCDAVRLSKLVRFPLNYLDPTFSDTLSSTKEYVRIETPAELAEKCRDNRKAWSIGGTLVEDLQATRFLGPRSALVSWDHRWWLDWDAARWLLVTVE